MNDHTIAASPSGQPLHAPRGAALACRGWAQEAAMRMLMNSLDPEVAEASGELILYGSHYKAARDWNCFLAIVASLRELENDQTLLVDGGRPIGIFRTQPDAPRVIVASGFTRLGLIAPEKSHGHSDRAGGEPFAAGNWMYVGAQTALPNMFERFSALAHSHFGGNLAGRLVITGGMGALGAAHPLAATLNGAAFLGIDASAESIKRRIKTGYCDVMVNDLDEALRILKNAVRKREPASVGLIGNCAAILPELARRGVVPDLLTDSILCHHGAHADLTRYIPENLNAAQAADLLRRDPRAYREQARNSIAAQMRGMVELQRLGSIVFDCGAGVPAPVEKAGLHDFFDSTSPGVETDRPVLPPPIDEDRVTVTCVALSGEPRDIARTDRLLLELFSSDVALQRWIAMARSHVRFQGLPARVCRLQSGQIDRFALAINALVTNQEVRAPIVIGEAAITENDGAWVSSEMPDEAARMPRPSLTPASIPPAPTDHRQERPDRNASCDWSIVNTLLDTPGAASWITLDDMGRGLARATRVIVADGTPETSNRLERNNGRIFRASYFQVSESASQDDAASMELARRRLIQTPMP